MDQEAPMETRADDRETYLDERRRVTSQVKKRLIEVLQLPVEEDQIGLDSPLFGAGLGLDSVDAVGLAAMIEEHFEVQVFDTDIQVFRSLNTMVDFILERLAEKAAGQEPAEIASEEVPPDLAAEVTPGPELAAAFAVYATVRNHVGLIDHSSMTKIEVSGEDAEPLVDYVVAGNVADLAVGSLMHSLVLDDDGAIAAIVWLIRHEGSYLLVSSPQRRRELLACLELHGDGREVEIADRSDEQGMLSLIGPRAQELVVDLFDDDLLRLGYGELEPRRREDGTEILIGRFGETGEFDYRLILPAGAVAELAAEIEDAGSIYGLRRCPAEALAPLMLEMKTIDQDTALAAGCTPSQVDLQWMVDGQKQEFLGREGFLASLGKPGRRAVIVVPEDGGGDRTGDEVRHRDQVVGQVQCSAYSFTLGRWIYLAYLDEAVAWPRLRFRLGGGGGPELTVTSRSAPLFITRTVVESLNV